MLEVGILKESLMFLLIGLFFIFVSGDPCYMTDFGSKSLGNKLITNPKCLGGIYGSLGKFRHEKNEEESQKTCWGNVGGPHL